MRSLRTPIPVKTTNMFEDPGTKSGQDPSKRTGLTSIPSGIHWAATPEPSEAATELEKINISTFQDTLAEVALAIIRRRKQLAS